MNLYVDDVRNAPDGWTLVRTVAEAKDWLRSGAVDELSLDHDLGYCASCEKLAAHIGDQSSDALTFTFWCPHVDDGYKLCLWMAETGHWSATKPVVHSANPVGAARMRGVINRYYGTKEGTPT